MFAGQSAQVACIVSEGDSPIAMEWRFDDKPLSATRGVISTQVAETVNLLQIPSLNPGNQGNYSCIAKNVAGSVSQSSILLINGNTNNNEIGFINFYFCLFPFYFIYLVQYTCEFLSLTFVFLCLKYFLAKGFNSFSIIFILKHIHFMIFILLDFFILKQIILLYIFYFSSIVYNFFKKSTLVLSFICVKFILFFFVVHLLVIDLMCLLITFIIEICYQYLNK